MVKTTRLTTSDFFAQLDTEFINVKTIEDETFHYNGKDVRVTNTWELPIIIQWPESSIQFEFSTRQGGIEFGIVFVPATDDEHPNADLEVETIEEMTRVRSDLSKISGSFQPRSEGVVFFLWDNAYDWSSTKKLNYSVHVFQPSFSLPDTDRSSASRKLLLDMLEDQETAQIRKDDGNDQITYYEPKVNTLSQELMLLRQDLTNKMYEYNTHYASLPLHIPLILFVLVKHTDMLLNFWNVKKINWCIKSILITIV